MVQYLLHILEWNGNYFYITVPCCHQHGSAMKITHNFRYYIKKNAIIIPTFGSLHWMQCLKHHFSVIWSHGIHKCLQNHLEKYHEFVGIAMKATMTFMSWQSSSLASLKFSEVNVNILSLKSVLQSTHFNAFLGGSSLFLPHCLVKIVWYTLFYIWNS